MPEADNELDKLYEEFEPPPQEQPKAAIPGTLPLTSSSSEKPLKSELLLTKEALPRILELFGLPASAGGDIYRALEQARVRVEERHI